MIKTPSSGVLDQDTNRTIKKIEAETDIKQPDQLKVFVKLGTNGHTLADDVLSISTVLIKKSRHRRHSFHCLYAPNSLKDPNPNINCIRMNVSSKALIESHWSPIQADSYLTFSRASPVLCTWQQSESGLIGISRSCVLDSCIRSFPPETNCEAASRHPFIVIETLTGVDLGQDSQMPLLNQGQINR
ncbi:hypothetical protein LXL04_017620 [Taraxacum kok-saghyz]